MIIDGDVQVCALERDLLKRVGELAADWNAGAQKLGLKLPAWVARHGSKRGAAAVINLFTRSRIILTNAVKYVTHVESYESPLAVRQLTYSHKVRCKWARAFRA